MISRIRTGGVSMKNRVFRLLSISVSLIAVLLATSSIAFSQGSTKGKLPGMIGIGTLAIGSGTHIMASTLTEVLKEKAGIKVRVIPLGAEMARMEVLRSGDAQFSAAVGGGLYFAEKGLVDFARADWGVQPLQLVWLGPAYVGLATTKAHKDINSVADVRGKRISFLPYYSAKIMPEGFLAFGGLTWNDVKPVPSAGYVDQFKALMAGAVDVVGIANPDPPIMYEVEAHPGGLKWIPFPHGDTESWKRLRQVIPWGVPGKVGMGPGLSKENPLEGYVHACGFVAYENTSPELVYLLTKTIGDNLQRLHNMAAAWKVYTMEIALSTKGYPHAYHEGAVKYFKEKGLWTPENEEWNQSQLEKQNRLKDAWKQFSEKAKAENLKPDSFKEEWHKTQSAITDYLPAPDVKKK